MKKQYRIPLMKDTFLNEDETKEELISFLKSAKILSMNEKCFQFENEFAQKQRSKYAVLFNSGGSANLALIQSLLNIGRINLGDNIAYSALTWSTNVFPIIQLGCNPVALDCNINSLNVSANNIADRRKEVDFNCLFLTNVLGFVDNPVEIIEYCKKHDILLIEDNCESLGTVYDGHRTGSFGLAATFSFYVAHHMSTIEGGMVCTDDFELAEMLRMVRANGWDRNLTTDSQIRLRTTHNLSEFKSKYSFYDLGYNLRPTEMTGFLGVTQLKYLDESIIQRQINYIKVYETINENEDMIPQSIENYSVISTFAFPLIFKSLELKNSYLEMFETNGIETRPIIAGNMQNQPFYKKYGLRIFATPVTNIIEECGFYCGNHPQLSESDINLIKRLLTK